MSVTYGVVKEVYLLGEKQRNAYGLVAYADAEQDETATVVASAHDISSDMESVRELAERCNQGNLSLIHFGDIVEDFLIQ